MMHLGPKTSFRQRVQSPAKGGAGDKTGEETKKVKIAWVFGVLEQLLYKVHVPLSY